MLFADCPVNTKFNNNNKKSSKAHLKGLRLKTWQNTYKNCVFLNVYNNIMNMVDLR